MRVWRFLVACCAPIAALAASPSQVISLDMAVSLAIADDLRTQALAAQADAHRKQQKAAMALPTPTVRTGLINMPMDDFALNAEPMTQGVIGVRQVISSRDSRQAASLTHEYQALGMSKLAAAAIKERLYATRVAWLNAHLFQREALLTVETGELLGRLSEIVRVRYAAGDELQLAVLAAELELHRLESRLLETRRLERNALTDLGRLIGSEMYVTVAAELPPWHEIPSADVLLDVLGDHPSLKAAAALTEVGGAQTASAQAQSKPEWHLDLSYGLRSGHHFDGTSRSDLASAMVTVSVPWLSKQQTQLRVEAARSNQEAARHSYEALWRDMKAELLKALEDWHSLTSRLELLEDAIVPQSKNHATAALQAFQNKEGSYTDVLLSYVDEVDAVLERHQVEVDRLKVWAKIDSLNGRTP